MSLRALGAALVALAALLAATELASCRTDDQGQLVVSWPAVAQEVELASWDLEDVAALVQEPELQERLLALSVDLRTVAAAIGTDGPSTGVLDAAERGLELADALLEQLPESAQEDARLAVSVARILLRRVRAYAGGS